MTDKFPSLLQHDPQTLMGEHRQRFLDPAAGGSSSRVQVRSSMASGAVVGWRFTCSEKHPCRLQLLWFVCRGSCVSSHTCPVSRPSTHASSARACLLLQALTDLAGISSQEAIASSRTAAALRGQRFAIRLCRASYELLAQHLQVGRLRLVAGGC